nr:transposon TX1 uncharacterized [Tanacetum cinerariifolium]
MLKKEIRMWTLDYKRQQVGHSKDLESKLSDIDKILDQGGVTDDILLSRMEVLKQLHDDQSSNNHIRFVISDLIKHEFQSHFANRFQDPGSRRCSLNFLFSNRLSNDQILDLESSISNDEIRTAVWGCGVDKSPGPNGFTFEFFRKYWAVVGPDFSIAVEWFFKHGYFAIGCNSSFVALISKVLDPKVVSDYRPISLIGSLYIFVTKILATRLSLVILDLILYVHTAFLPNRQILDGGPFSSLFVFTHHGVSPLIISRAVKAGIFIGFRVDHSITLSHLFYANDAVFIGVGIPDNCVVEAAKSIGCSIMKAPFKYLGILVGDNMSSIKAWVEVISKMKKMLSRWKLNTLSFEGHLTLLKSVLGSTPTYNMSIFKVPKYVLNLMESLRRNFLMAFKMVIERLLGSNGLRGCIQTLYAEDLEDRGVSSITTSSSSSETISKHLLSSAVSSSFSNLYLLALSCSISSLALLELPSVTSA